jgi:two-component system nitrogen regulation sensor histidine kinase NtrY
MERSTFLGERAEHKRRQRERNIIVAVALLLVCSTALTVYLSGPTTFLSLASNILVFGLLSLNAVLILLLLFLVVRNLVKLLFERKRGIFGAKLRTKYVVAFVGFSVIPAVLLFAVALTYISKSTDLWLNNQVEQSLRMSKEVVEAYRRKKGEDSLEFARQISRYLARDPRFSKQETADFSSALEERRRLYQLDFLILYSTRMESLAAVFSARIPKEGRRVFESRKTSRAVHGEEWIHTWQLLSGEVIEGFVPVYSSYDPKDMAGLIAAGYLIPPRLGEQMEGIVNSYQQYYELRNKANPIKLNYYVLLSIALLVVIFLSSWYGFYLSKQITIPLQALAEKTQAVALGQLDFQLEEVSRDEVGVLVESFNRMTQRLKRSQQALEASHQELRKATQEAEQRRRYMEFVFRNVAAGVIALDADNRITTINRAAEEMLEIQAGDLVNQSFRRAMDNAHQPILRALVKELELGGRESIRREVHLNRADGPLSLNVSVNVLRDEEGAYLGMVVVFDDVTELQKAERMIAWKEVARRIAHEIKNPLTPIKLSAQRLRRRYLPDLLNQGAVLDECTTTIIEQVDHLQGMVNEFQRFARMPTAQPVPEDLNRIIEDVLALYRGSHPQVRIEFNADEEIPTVPLDRDQIRRVLINLVENALAVLPETNGVIQIRTSFNKRLRVVRLELADNGPGIPSEDKARLFEPYYSTKTTGTGLGLTIVRSIVLDHRGYIRVMDNETRGTRFVIELPL